jgi:imidazolonepropionase-like amidohydrolase
VGGFTPFVTQSLTPAQAAATYFPIAGGTVTPGGIGLAFGSLDVESAGQGVKVAEGANAKQGVATLVAGTVTVANTSVTANSRIFLTVQSLGTVAVPSGYCVSARTPGTSFTILASVATDTSVVAYEIFEPG